MECCLFHQIKLKHFFYRCLSDASDGKESACNVGDTGSKAGSGRCAGEGNGYPSSILAWRIPWTEEPGRLKSMELQRTGHD